MSVQNNTGFDSRSAVKDAVAALSSLYGRLVKGENAYSIQFTSPGATGEAKRQAMERLEFALEVARSRFALSVGGEPADPQEAFSSAFSYQEGGAECQVTARLSYFKSQLETRSNSELWGMATHAGSDFKSGQKMPMFAALALKSAQALSWGFGTEKEFRERLVDIVAQRQAREQVTKLWEYAHAMASVASEDARALSSIKKALPSSLQKFRQDKRAPDAGAKSATGVKPSSGG